MHVVVGKDQLRILTHPKKGETVELLRQPHRLDAGAWHRLRIEFKGLRVSAAIDDVTITAAHDCIAEEKLSFGLGGDSGGPEGEKAGALEFRKLTITCPP